MLDDCVFIVSTSSLACTNLFILWCIKQLNFVHNIHTRTGHTFIHQSSQNFFFVVSSTIRNTKTVKFLFVLTSNSRADVAVGRLSSFSVCLSTHEFSTTMLVWRLFINPIACSTLRSLSMINNFRLVQKVSNKRLTFQLIEHKCYSIGCWDVRH